MATWRLNCRVIPLAAGVVALLTACGLHSARRSGPSDLSAWLQPRLDRAGGRVFLPRLPNGKCYVTHGLWVSRSDTTIVSNGACLRVVGSGPVRLHSADGDPIGASAAFFVSRRPEDNAPPAHVRISGLRIVVEAPRVDGIDVYATDVRIDRVTITGSPFDDVYIGGRTNVVYYSQRVSLRNSSLAGAQRNAISVTAAKDVRIVGNRIVGAAGFPGAGIDVEPNAPDNPIVGLLIRGNVIEGNVGAGIALALRPEGGLPAAATGIVIERNVIRGNDPGRGCAITLTGGQRDGRGDIVLRRNELDRPLCG